MDSGVIVVHIWVRHSLVYTRSIAPTKLSSGWMDDIPSTGQNGAFMGPGDAVEGSTPPSVSEIERVLTRYLIPAKIHSAHAQHRL